MNVSRQFLRDFAYLANRYGWTTADVEEVKAEIGAAEDRANRAMVGRGALQKRVKTLEEQNAALRAENRDLIDRLRRSAVAQQHLAETGRMLPT